MRSTGKGVTEALFGIPGANVLSKYGHLMEMMEDGHGSNANFEIWLCRLFMMQSTVCGNRFLKIVAEIKFSQTTHV